MVLLEHENYIHRSRLNESSQAVTYGFLTHLNSVKLLNAFSLVLLMHNTYTTNRYRLSLLKIVGDGNFPSINSTRARIRRIGT